MSTRVNFSSHLRFNGLNTALIVNEANQSDFAKEDADFVCTEHRGDRSGPVSKSAGRTIRGIPSDRQVGQQKNLSHIPWPQDPPNDWQQRIAGYLGNIVLAVVKNSAPSK